jgi:hypothetical protein
MTTTQTRLNTLEKRITKIKAELGAIDEMRPGTLTRQYSDAQHRYGPYYQLSYTWNMKSRTQYIARDHVREVRRQIAAYKRFKALTTQWIALSIEHSRLKMKFQA